MTPAPLSDAAGRVLVLEDLGAAERLDHALLRGGAVEDALAALGRLLGTVHAATAGAVAPGRFANRQMRAPPRPAGRDRCARWRIAHHTPRGADPGDATDAVCDRRRRAVVSRAPGRAAPRLAR